jgi:hypothetical protein
VLTPTDEILQEFEVIWMRNTLDRRLPEFGSASLPVYPAGDIVVDRVERLATLNGIQ